MTNLEKGPVGFVLIICSIFMMAASAFAQDTIMRAKIGIMAKSGDKSWYVKSQEMLKKGDKLRIYVRPETMSHVYLVHTDKKSASLLINNAQINGTKLALPSEKDFYQIDGESPIEVFTIICSSEEIIELSKAESSELSYGQWASIEEKLIRRSKIELGQAAEKSIPLAGGIRGGPSECPIPTFSGRLIIVKKYEFSVKK